MLTDATAPDIAPSPILLIHRGDAPHSDRAVRTGELTVVMRGVYARAREWGALAPWDRYLTRVHAAVLRYPDAVFVLESGAALRALPVFHEPRDVHVVLPPGATSRAMSGVRVHTARSFPESEELSGILVATPAELAVDIARARHNAIGLAVANAVLRASRHLSVDEFRDINASRLSSRGRRHAEWVLERASAVPESPLESVSLAVIEWLGFASPDLQQWILGPDEVQDDRVDFWWRFWRIAGEADGDLKVSGAFGDAREALRARRLRDARLLDRGVTATAHWGWSDVVTVKPLRAALISAGLPIERPEDAAQLHSLRRVLAPSLARLQ